MIDSEVERLRALRGAALKVRAVARSLSGSEEMSNDPLLNQGACAAWRIARAVSGHLYSHPYIRFQKGASLGVLLGNSLSAKLTALTASNRAQALAAFEAHLKSLTRELDDARSLTKIAELSELLGRSQNELRWLAAAVECARHGGRRVLVAGDTAAGESRALGTVGQTSPVCLASGRSDLASASPTDWPYLAF